MLWEDDTRRAGPATSNLHISTTNGPDIMNFYALESSYLTVLRPNFLLGKINSDLLQACGLAISLINQSASSIP
jgi:hypothetical protein